MSEYPASPVPQIPYEITSNWKTIVSAFDSGKEQRRQKQTYPKYDIGLTYNALVESDFAILWNFYQSMSGSLTAFYFYTIESSDWDGLFIGTGDASTQTFDIPGKSITNNIIYYNGEAWDDYEILVGGGSENSDRIIFDTAPEVNAILLCDFTGYMRIRCRFEEDKLTKQSFAGKLYRTGIKLKGLTAI